MLLNGTAGQMLMVLIVGKDGLLGMVDLDEMLLCCGRRNLDFEVHLLGGFTPEFAVADTVLSPHHHYPSE
jgi:hypothetical protein